MLRREPSIAEAIFLAFRHFSMCVRIVDAVGGHRLRFAGRLSSFRTMTASPTGYLMRRRPASLLSVVCVLILSVGFSVSAKASTSAHYSIMPDTLDGGGGVAGSSDYAMVGSLESSVIGQSDSADYQIGHGYLQQAGGVVTSISGRYIFYNNSAWDGNDSGANTNDDRAIAIDKLPLLKGTATFLNYSSFRLGLNGVMVDVFNLPPGTLAAGDFSFKMGNNNTHGSWPAAPAPVGITVRRGAGVGGSDRVTIIWSDATAPKKTWLRVALLPTTGTGLSQNSVFYFANAVGDSGNSSGDARVTIADELLARNNPASVLNPASITNRFDYNRDKRVTTVDQLIARDNPTSVLNELLLITVADGTVSGLAGHASASSLAIGRPVDQAGRGAQLLVHGVKE